MPKLNMWHRLGLVVTIIWQVAYPLWKTLEYSYAVEAQGLDLVRTRFRANLKIDCAALGTAWHVSGPEF
jgi:hypothetical protein